MAFSEDTMLALTVCDPTCAVRALAQPFSHSFVSIAEGEGISKKHREVCGSEHMGAARYTDEYSN